MAHNREVSKTRIHIVSDSLYQKIPYKNKHLEKMRAEINIGIQNTSNLIFTPFCELEAKETYKSS